MDSVTYTYGDRIRTWFGNDQITSVVNKLINDPLSKSGVIVLWDPTWDNTHSGSPCLNHLWFRIREGKLYLTVTIRSNDMFAAWPANAYTMRRLQAHVRNEIEEWNFGDNYNPDLDLDDNGYLGMGSLTIVSQSAHLYAHSYTDAEEIVEKEYRKIVLRDRRRYFDPKGSFIISIDFLDGLGEVIKVEHMTPGDNGVVIDEYIGYTAMELIKMLTENNVLTDPYHMMYIGTELQKAELALRGIGDIDVTYVQDQPLHINS